MSNGKKSYIHQNQNGSVVEGRLFLLAAGPVGCLPSILFVSYIEYTLLFNRFLKKNDAKTIIRTVSLLRHSKIKDAKCNCYKTVSTKGKTCEMNFIEPAVSVLGPLKF